MRTDLVLDAFGADTARLLDIARVADDAGFGAVWVNDHFSGAVLDAPWSRDPFALLGALSQVTARVDLGLLVANMVNRHPAQLASAVNTLQSLAPGRIRLGVGSGAAPGSRFAVEHEMIGTELADAAGRRSLLREYIGELRSIFAGASSVTGVVDGAPLPPVIVGASAWPTIELATEVADGVNIRRTHGLAEQLARIAAVPVPDGFEVSVLENGFEVDETEHPADLAGVERRLLTVPTDVDLDRLRALGERLAG